MSWNSPRRTLWWGETATATLKGVDSNAAEPEVLWTSSENNVVSVEGEGLECTLTAKSLGSATIIATVEGEKVASGTVTVVDTAPGVVSIRVSQDEVTISSGETYTINATVEMEKADMTPATIKWSSNNTSVAEVDSEGVITAREVGNAIIKGVAGEKTVEIAVEVVENPNSTPHDSTQDAGREPEEGQDATNNNNNSNNNSNSNNSSNNQNNSSNGGGTTSGNRRQPARRGMETRPTAAQGIPPPAGRAAQPMAAPPAAREPAAQTPGPDNKPCRARTGPTGPVRVL